MTTAYEQKVAFDTVDDATPISAEQIAELLRNFAVVSNTPRLAAIVTVIASSLDDLGVETYGDMRRVTTTMYVEDCGVKKFDAQRSVEHFTRQVTVDAHGDVPEVGAPVTRSEFANLAPEGVVEATDGAENSPVDSGIDPGEDWTVERMMKTTSMSRSSIVKLFHRWVRRVTLRVALRVLVRVGAWQAWTTCNMVWAWWVSRSWTWIRR